MHIGRRIWIAVVVGATVVMGCGDDKGPAADFEQLSIAVCAPSAGPFSTTIDNEYFPLAVGSRWVFEGVDDGAALRVEMTVLDETEDVAGVTTRVVEVSEREDGELIEISRDFYAQAPDGTVCYYGEDVDVYEGGSVVGHSGQWRAGDNDNAAGILMPGTPRVETKFQQEYAPGTAEDMSAIMALGESVTVTAGSFTDALWAIDWNPLEGDTSADGEDKYYARGIGLVVDDVAELVSYDLD